MWRKPVLAYQTAVLLRWRDVFRFDDFSQAQASGALWADVVNAQNGEIMERESIKVLHQEPLTALEELLLVMGVNRITFL